MVQTRAEDLMRQQVTDSLLASTYLVAEKLTAYMNELDSTVQLIAETVQDRIVGYPQPGWETDAYVPFVDMGSESEIEVSTNGNSYNTTRTSTRRNFYPLAMPSPPMDWNITPNVNSQNAQEHLPGRASLLNYFPAQSITTASGAYFQQGACDPSVTNPHDMTYFPNCTNENNNFATGGKLMPTTTSAALHAKSGDLTVFLKPLFEAHSDMLMTGIYYANSGAGAVLQFPGIIRDGTTPPYVSIGCDWMRSINPVVLQNEHNPQQGPAISSAQPQLAFATEEQIALCRQAGLLVSARQYNPLERDWFRQFALGGGAIDWYGPDWTENPKLPMLHVGKGIFDRMYVNIMYHEGNF